MPFEILLRSGQRIRYEDPKYTWQFGLVSGSKEKLDKTTVEVLTEARLFAYYANVCAVGDVIPDVALVFPLEKRVTACPRYGYKEYE